MVHLFDGFNDIIRLNKGERLSDVINTFSTANDLPGAWINGVGGVMEVTLGYYDIQAKEYHWKTFDDVREITSLQGNLAKGEDGKMIFHVHGQFADSNYQAVGGHVKDFIAAATVELFLHRTYKPLQRKHDDEVGLALLDLA